MVTEADDELGGIADLVLNVGRLLRARTPTSAQLVEMTETERHVMRIVDLHPGITPSEIARRGRLQRTNVSTTLRSLEGKGLVDRVASSGRTTMVGPTPLAQENLARLRAAWYAELAGLLATPEEVEAVKQCAQMLMKMEDHLILPPEN